MLMVGLLSLPCLSPVVATFLVSHLSEDLSMSIRPKPQLSSEDYDLKVSARMQTSLGSEVPDATPMAPPIGFKKQPSMVEHMRAMVRSEMLRQAAEASGNETFEEADDFDVPDDLVPMSGFENDPEFEPPLPTSDPTGVPSPSGEGKGQGGTLEPTEGPKPAEVAAAPQPAPASPKPE